MQVLQHLNEVKTPAYVIEEKALRRNCEILAHLAQKSGAKVLVALKGFAFSRALKIVGEYLSGACCSGLWEAKFAREFMGREIHSFSPAFKDGEFDEIAQLSQHIVFNSIFQLESFKKRALERGVSVGIRCNVEFSVAPKELYNPCGRFSRLGVLAKDLENGDLSGVEGLHFHALCEESAQSLKLVLDAFRSKFRPFLKGLKWVNFGGGHHITKKGYDIDLLSSLCRDFADEFGVQIYLEPGEAVGWCCGSLVGSVIDLVRNEKDIALLDVSSEAHMPDTIIMPYTSEVANARILATRDGESVAALQSGEFPYLLEGNTCLAGDVMGEYAFKSPLKRGDKVVFLDQAHYSIVKNTTFNGVILPNLLFLREDGSIEVVREFGYEEFRRRN